MFCECGCGELAPIATGTRTREGWVRGQPIRFINGHQRRKQPTWQEVDAGYATPCWEWGLARMSKGYGTHQKDGRTVLAHRLMYEFRVGPIPEGLDLDHLCRNRCCVNPEHLEPVTRAENLRRGKGKRTPDATCATIRELYARGSTKTEIARQLGMPLTTVRNIANGARRAA